MFCVFISFNSELSVSYFSSQSRNAGSCPAIAANMLRRTLVICPRRTERDCILWSAGARTPDYPGKQALSNQTLKICPKVYHTSPLYATANRPRLLFLSCLSWMLALCCLLLAACTTSICIIAEPGWLCTRRYTALQNWLCILDGVEVVHASTYVLVHWCCPFFS